MEIPSEVILAKEELEDPLLDAELITGIDFGVRDEDQRDPDDLALRVFVADLEAIPAELQSALAGFPFPTVVLQRVFSLTQSSDTAIHRPVLGGVSVAAARFVGGDVPVGTLGAIVHHPTQPDRIFGLSNYHVLCHDSGRQEGEEIIQPEPGPDGRRVPGDHLGTLERFAFPETTRSGVVDAAICSIDVDFLAEIEELGSIAGTTFAAHTMPVTKRGRSTGKTFGWISGMDGAYLFNYPHLPPVGSPPTIKRRLKRQMQIHVDFPRSIVFGEEGDSGSVVVGPDNLVVGLYWGSGSEKPDDPLTHGVATPIQNVELALNISFDAPFR